MGAQKVTIGDRSRDERMTFFDNTISLIGRSDERPNRIRERCAQRKARLVVRPASAEMTSALMVS